MNKYNMTALVPVIHSHQKKSHQHINTVLLHFSYQGDRFHCATAAAVRRLCSLFSLLVSRGEYNCRTDAQSKSVFSRALHLHFLISWYQKVWCKKSLCYSIFYRGEPQRHCSLRWSQQRKTSQNTNNKTAVKDDYLALSETDIAKTRYNAAKYKKLFVMLVNWNIVSTTKVIFQIFSIDYVWNSSPRLE